MENYSSNNRFRSAIFNHGEYQRNGWEVLFQSGDASALSWLGSLSGSGRVKGTRRVLLLNFSSVRHCSHIADCPFQYGTGYNPAAVQAWYQLGTSTANLYWIKFLLRSLKSVLLGENVIHCRNVIVWHLFVRMCDEFWWSPVVTSNTASDSDKFLPDRSDVMAGEWSHTKTVNQNG